MFLFSVDHMVLRYLINNHDLSGQIVRWIFDYKVVYKLGRMHVQADYLSRIDEEEATGAIIDDTFVDAPLFGVSTVQTQNNHVGDVLSTQSMPEDLFKDQTL